MTGKHMAGCGARCAFCLLLCAALLAACASGAEPDASGRSAPVLEGAGQTTPENAADSPADGEDITDLPFGDAEETVFPESDRAAALPGGTVTLRMDSLSFARAADGTIGYTVENTTGHSVGVVFAPRLERWTDGAWEWVKSEVGFCGTPDSIDETHSGSLSQEWFPGLTEGIYRLTYTVAYDGEDALAEELPFSACFSLTADG